MEYGREDFIPSGGVLRRSFHIYGANMGGIILFAVLLGGTPQVLQSLAGLAIFVEFFQWTGWEEMLRALLAGRFDRLPILAEMFAPRTMGEVVRLAGFGLLISMAGLVTGVLITPFVTGGITNMAAGTLHGVRKTGGQWWAATRPFYGRLVVTGLCFVLVDLAFSIVFSMGYSAFVAIVAVGSAFWAIAPAANLAAISYAVAPLAAVLLSLVGFVVYHAFRGLLFPVAVGEGRYYFGAVGKALKFAVRHAGACLGVMIVTGLLCLLWDILATVGGILMVVLGGAPQAVGVASAVFLYALALPLPLIAFTVLYYDLCAKTEKG